MGKLPCILLLIILFLAETVKAKNNDIVATVNSASEFLSIEGEPSLTACGFNPFLATGV
jgi:hypothetical protein